MNWNKNMRGCLRCGKCCYLVIEGTVTTIPCKYLLVLNNGKTLCKVYLRNRIGRDIGYGNKCIHRVDSPLTYEGCPFNV